MGKRRSKAGLSGLSQFVNALHQDPSQIQPTVSSVIIQSLDETHLQGGDYRETKGENFAEEAPGKNFKYNARSLVPCYNDISQVPERLKKYFSQRTRFFSLYDKPPGCLLDEEGWYSVTPERIADQIAERCRCNVILDAFCGVGGNAIAFAKTCERVIALDINPTRLALARHNAQIYGVADRIEFIQADYISFVRAYFSMAPSDSTSPLQLLSKSFPSLSNSRKKIDVVFLSPPWGGPSYLSGSQPPLDNNERKSLDPYPAYSLSSIQPIHGKDLFAITRKVTPNVVYYLPRNSELSEISSLLEGLDDTGRLLRLPGERVEVEEEWMGSKLKALTCYFGGLVTGQDHLF